MGNPRFPDPVLLVVAAFSRHLAALQWAEQHLIAEFGPIAMKSPILDFDQTHYYEATMGADLRKQFLAFAQLVPADSLARHKQTTNRLEAVSQSEQRYAEARPLNLDPGILSLGKFQLATTKDQAHRIYLSDGIFAEVTLRYQDREFVPWPWTYADYQTPAVRQFLNEARRLYRRQLREAKLGQIQATPAPS